jgi:DNA-binding MarR family transcriptional regulator
MMTSNNFDTKEKNQRDIAGPHSDAVEEMLVALRRVMRAVDIHSRRLVQSHGLTGPQAVVLKEVVRAATLTSGELAKRVNLGQGTVTEIVKRLESRQLLKREQSDSDRRRVNVSPTQAGCDVIAESPPLLQETFAQRFSALKDWEQNLLLSSVQRVAELMDAEQIDAAPMLSSGSIGATAQAVSAVVAPEPSQGQRE